MSTRDTVQQGLLGLILVAIGVFTAMPGHSEDISWVAFGIATGLWITGGVFISTAILNSTAEDRHPGDE